MLLNCATPQQLFEQVCSSRYVSLQETSPFDTGDTSLIRQLYMCRFIRAWHFWVELYNGLSEMSLVSVQFQNKRACLAKYEAYDVWSSNNRRLYSLTLLSCQAGTNNTTLMPHRASDSCSDWHHTNNMVWMPQVSWKRPLAKDISAWERKEGKPR